VIYLTLRQSKPEWAITGTLAFAWNPLVLLESVQNAHNDIVMVFFLAAALYALQYTVTLRQQPSTSQRTQSGQNEMEPRHARCSAQDAGRWLYPLLVCLFLALSILTKFITVLIVPFFLLALISNRQTWKSRLPWLLGYTWFTGGVVVAGMCPLWPGWDTWAVLNSGDAAGRSVLALMILALRDLIGSEAAFAVAEKFSQAMFVLIYGYAAWRVIKRTIFARDEGKVSPSALDPSQRFQQIAASSFLVLFWYVLLVAPVFHAWYLLWFWPLAVLLLPQRRPLDATIVFSITALFVIPYFETIRVWYPVLLRNPLLGHIIGVSLLTVPPILTLLWPKKPASPPAG